MKSETKLLSLLSVGLGIGCFLWFFIYFSSLGSSLASEENIFRFRQGDKVNNSDCISTPPLSPVFSERAESILYEYDDENIMFFRGMKESSVSFSPLTNWTQTYIHNHQNPPDCSKAVTSVTDGWPSGLGSEMHVISSHLAFAIQNGFVLTWGSSSCSAWVEQSSCAHGCACIFRKLTHCQEAPDSIHISGGNHQHLVPDVIKNVLHSEVPSMTSEQMLYWWRAQGVAYLMRLNRHSLSEIRNMRLDSRMHYMSGFEKVPFPLPHGTLNAHIRQGDKSREMNLVEANVFVDRYFNKILEMPNSFSRILFVSSDDQRSIEVCKEALERVNHSIVYTHLNRMDGGHDFSRLDAISPNRTQISLLHLLQLLMSLEADGWIGTRGSNWNRLIDELRCVWINKCLLMYEEVGDISRGDYNW